MSLIVEDYGLAPVKPYAPVGLKAIVCPHVVKSTELIGIEVEVENAGGLNANLNRVWSMVQDGSLRNNGIELVSQPIPACAAPVALQYLLGTFLNENCCFSPRTSVHVHLNVQDLTRGQALDLILLYAIYEKLFYKFTGRGRQKNIYCVPLSDCELLPNLCEFGETRNNAWSKYTGLNTLPIRSYGTIEFRHMHGTFDVEKLTVWINLITSLKEYIKRSSTKHIRQTIAEMNDGFDFEAFLREIFGDYAGAFKYAGPQELNYMQAKQAMAARAPQTKMAVSANKASAYYTFKG